MSIIDRDLGDLLFYASLAIIVSLTFTANIEPVAAALLPLSYVALGALVLAMVFRIRRYSAVEILVLCGLGAISLYQFVACGDNSLMKLVLLLAAMKGISFDRCIRFDLTLRVIWTIALVALSYVGAAEDIVTSDALRGVRHSLGFSNANQLGMAVLIEVLEALYLMGFKLRLLPAVAFSAVATWLDAMSGSRSSTAFIFLALILAAVNTFWPRVIRGRAFKSVSVCAVPVLFVLTWATVFLYQQGNPVAVELNETLTNRVWHIDAYAKLFDPTLFGSDLSSAGMTLDTLYAYLVYGHGIVISLAYLIAQPLLVRNLWERGEYGLVITLLVLSFYGLSERLWLCVEYDALMLAFAALLYGPGYRFASGDADFAEWASQPCPEAQRSRPARTNTVRTISGKR